MEHTCKVNTLDIDRRIGFNRFRFPDEINQVLRRVNELRLQTTKLRVEESRFFMWYHTSVNAYSWRSSMALLGISGKINMYMQTLLLTTIHSIQSCGSPGLPVLTNVQFPSISSSAWSQYRESVSKKAECMLTMACPAVPEKLYGWCQYNEQLELMRWTCPDMNSLRLSLAATHSDWWASSLGTMLRGED